MSNSTNTTGNRTRDLPACSAVPQPTAPPRAPIFIIHAYYNYIINARYNYYIANKGLVEECDKEEHLEVTAAAATSCSKRRL
jgi:hypothetical protein